MAESTVPRESERFSEWDIWDRRGGNEKVNALPSRPSSSRPTTSRLQSSHRQTVQWPFLQNLVITETSDAGSETSSIRPLTSSYPRRSTWQHGNRHSSVSLLDMVPDYIINYLRGETPETLARKREMKMNPDPDEIAAELRNRFGPDEVSDTGSEHGRPQTGGSQEDRQQMLPNESSEDVMNVRRFMKGWRGGVVVNCLLTGIVVLVTVMAFVIAIATERNGETRIFTGTCSKSQSANFGIHVAISLVSTSLLVAANYGFQILTSPTRVEVDMAHDAKSWLDIGVPSLRNLKSITRTRVVLACVLLTAAVSVQVIYQSVVFTTQRPTENGSSTCSLDSYDASLGIAILLSFVTLVCIGSLLALSNFGPLVTLGDAVASFLKKPDHTTRGACLMSKPDAEKGTYALDEPKVYTAQHHSWLQTPSRTRWIVWAATWAMPAALVATLLARALIDGVPLRSPFDSLSLPISNTRIFRLNNTSNHAAPAFIAALPQILVALLYLTTNSLLTTCALSHEFSRYANPGTVRPLRVSVPEPKGYQTTSLFLTLPRPYSWLLFAIFMPLSLFLSFSLRPLVVDSGNDAPQELAILLDVTSLLVAAALLVLILGLALLLVLRRADNRASSLEDGTPAGNPLVLRGGSCSAVISARTRRLPSDQNAEQGLLSWGVIRDGNGSEPGAVGFSTMGTERLCPGKLYA